MARTRLAALLATAPVAVMIVLGTCGTASADIGSAEPRTEVAKNVEVDVLGVGVGVGVVIGGGIGGNIGGGISVNP